MGESRKQSSAGAGAGAAAGSSPCAACKLLRRRCAKDCVFAPYFPADEPQKFASVHKVFGASNVNKMLQELPEQQRGDAVSSMVYEANARVRDPVYGCVGAISSLQKQVDLLQTQLALAQAEMVQLRMRHHDHHHFSPNNNSSNSPPPHHQSNSTSPNSSSIRHITQSHDNRSSTLFTMGESLWSC